MTAALNVQHETFEKCVTRNRGGQPCRNLNTCLHCRNAIAKGWNQYLASAIVALIVCVRNCERWEELQEKQKTAIQRFVTANATGRDLHPQRIADSNWWHLIQANGDFPPLLSLLLLKLTSGY